MVGRSSRATSVANPATEMMRLVLHAPDGETRGLRDGHPGNQSVAGRGGFVFFHIQRHL